ncbi:MAG: aminopeptidase [Clostridia bacterium]|nr:aminopeptidase [Clostridia bacterium]
MSENLTYKKETVYKKTDAENISAAFDYAEGYKSFLNSAKTEREAVKTAIAMLKPYGFKEYSFGDEIKIGDRLYYNNRNKNLFVFVIGSDGASDGLRIVASHIDAPRLDIKQCPVYEDSGLLYFKTHYYGGIRKYQWVATPLALHGVVVTKELRCVDICIGEDDNDPIFYITDLLPHLGREQSKLPLSEGIKGEQLNVILGNIPSSEDDDDSVKAAILKLINEKYGITEEDFLSSELCVVPALKARDVGFDRSLIGSYGHDDRVCAYPSLTALTESLDSKHSMLCILADKEETGSDGASGMQSDLMLDIINEIANALKISPALLRAKSKCLSADVCAGFDPTFPEVFEKMNSAIVGCGAVFTKYTGSGGKYDTNDANAEFVAWLRAAMEKSGVVWQAAELGKVDAGGGGTVAKYISKHNIETIDLGVPLLAMHAPYELAAKVDVYETHRAIKAFYNFD